MLRQKLHAGALQFVLYVAIVVALLITAFIVLVYTHKRFSIKTDFIIETTQNADKGIQYALQNTITLNDTTTINLKDEAYKTLKVYRDYWGVFEKVTAVATTKKNKFTKAALIGGAQPKNDRVALYVKDNNKPLVVVGNTRIEGTAYLPKQGIKSGTISGTSYYGTQLIYGNKRIASQFPQLFSATKTQIGRLEKQLALITQDQFLNIESGKPFSNSFLNPIKMVFSNTQIHLSDITLTGHIVVQSRTKISVDASANLKDIVLIAPEIDIKSGVRGQFQALATKQLNVANNVLLNYPSALVVNENSIQQKTQNNSTEQQQDNHQITIDKQSIIKGSIIYLGQSKPNNFRVQLQLNENATVIGEVYCNQNLELLGQVTGTIYANNFIAKQSGSIYQNHIYNGTILANDLPQEFVGIAFNTSEKRIAKWLY